LLGATRLDDLRRKNIQLTPKEKDFGWRRRLNESGPYAETNALLMATTESDG
jgi:hypothetical protein